MSSAATPRLFGTDGIRGPFGSPPLDRPGVTSLGYHLAGLLRQGRRRPEVVMGGDTRASTPELGAWLADGLRRGGAKCRWAGVLPTPAVARLIGDLGADCGIAISASHNPWPDNGIKLIDARGFKWAREAETELEARLGEPTPAAGAAAALEADPNLGARYLDDLAATLPGRRPLAGLRIAIDAANGAASPWAGDLFRRLGAEVVLRADRPDGRNINLDCGSTHPRGLARLTLESRCRLGAAFDGDADRAVFADETGAVRDGDAALYLWACALLEAGRLDPPRVVATTMSNFGLERALAERGVELVRCDVGDREVVETMRREGIALGGEQSGHLVHLGLGTTGDGMLTALHVAALVGASGREMSELLAPFRRYPQVLRNVVVASKPELGAVPAVAAAARATERALAGRGRLVLRYSGTEPLARVMIEGADAAEVGRLAEELSRVIERELGAEGAVAPASGGGAPAAGGPARRTE